MPQVTGQHSEAMDPEETQPVGVTSYTEVMPDVTTPVKRAPLGCFPQPEHTCGITAPFSRSLQASPRKLFFHVHSLMPGIHSQVFGEGELAAIEAAADATAARGRRGALPLECMCESHGRGGGLRRTKFFFGAHGIGFESRIPHSNNRVPATGSRITTILLQKLQGLGADTVCVDVGAALTFQPDLQSTCSKRLLRLSRSLR